MRPEETNRRFAALDEGTLLDLLRQSFLFTADPVLPKNELLNVFACLYAHAAKGNEVDTLLAPFQSPQQGCTVYLTHDVDWLDPQHPYSWLKFTRQFIQPRKTWFDLRHMLQQDVLLRNIEQLLQFEQEQNLHSIFFIGATKDAMGRQSVRYTVDDPLYAALIDALKKHKATIGLHSCNTAHDPYAMQQARLEKHAQQAVRYHRSHFLHYDVETLFAQLEQAGLLFDMSMGKAQQISFASGTCRAYRGIDLQRMQMSKVTEVPLLLMDNAFFWLPEQQVMDDFKRNLDHAMQHNGTFSILFHPENMLLKPRLWDLYEQVAGLCRNSGANFAML